jgi:phosphonate transport system substrate-binding protein
MNDRPVSYVLLVVVAVIFGACPSTPYEEVEVDPGKPHQDEAGPDGGSGTRSLKVAVAAMISPEETHRQYKQLVDRIGELVARPARFHQRRTYREVNDLLTADKIDVAFLCTGGYLHLKRSIPKIEVLAVPVVAEKPTYNSLIIVGTGSSAQKLEDLKGVRFAFTDPLSNTGCIYPRHAIKELKQDAKAFFSSTIFTHSHDRSVRAVAKGLVDAAAVDSLVFERMLAQGDQEAKSVRVLVRSPDFGNPPVVASPNLPVEMKERLKKVLLSLHEDAEAQELLKQIGIDRFAPATPGLYKSAAAMLPQGKQ